MKKIKKLLVFLIFAFIIMDVPSFAGKPSQKFIKSEKINELNTISISANIEDEQKFISDFMSLLEKPYRKMWALIIGIDNYNYLPQLKSAVKGAKMVKKMLIENYGFSPEDIIELYDEDATRDNISMRLDKLSDPKFISFNDGIFMFFAGHGLIGKDKKGYIMPVDGIKEKEISTGISIDQLRSFYTASPAKHILIAIDACYSGAIFTRGIGLRDKSTVSSTMHSNKARVAVTAAKGDEQIVDFSDNGLSYFTYYLLEGLEGKADKDQDNIILSSELVDYIVKNVRYKTNQHPEYGRLEGDDGGELLFIKASQTTAPPIVSTPTATQPSAIGTVIISVNPEDAKIYINGGFVGTGNVKRNLEVGRNHQIEVKLEGFKSISETFSLNKDEVKTFNFKLYPVVSTVTINTNPTNAIIYINDEIVGNSPLVIELKYGDYEVKAVKPGYITSKRKIRIRSENPVTELITLQESPETIANRIYKEKISSKKKTAWFSLITSIAFGVVSGVLHLKSEQSYNSYLNSYELSHIQSNWNQYKRLLMYRNISIGISATFGVASIYFFLKKINYEKILRDVRKGEYIK
ncbi:PEGA domain-containing protein [Candidatus Kryptobacter tengchongensis]|uniref:PEGA domain-containing protein n=1 Tax=Kryptobacter tengchongensis TaxID=1643429 RepID=A0A916PDP6_KRYT1|nr:PEGA domain-containing protein [Candidatus Kryptobacter tengchongensis]CUS96791.1 PEGA domain-containing protein [Candidatus Kryptobacter tengchongensis]